MHGLQHKCPLIHRIHSILFDVWLPSQIDIMYELPTVHTTEKPTTEYAARLKKNLSDAYSLVCDKLQTSHKRRKENYDRRIHGKPYQDGDLVWLHSSVVTPGQSRKLHHPWTGPYKVVERIAESDYRIKGLRGKKRTLIVHFDRLKLCTPGTRFTIPFDDTPSHLLSQPQTLSDPHTFGEDMELLHDLAEPEEPDSSQHRYPQRNRQPPTWLHPIVTH